jgi:hypothetical protein
VALAELFGVVFGVELRIGELGVQLPQLPHLDVGVGGRDVGLLLLTEADLDFLHPRDGHQALPPFP